MGITSTLLYIFALSPVGLMTLAHEFVPKGYWRSPGGLRKAVN